MGYRKSIDGLAALVELDIKVAVFDPVLFVFLNKPRNRGEDIVLGAQRPLPLACFKTSTDASDEAIVLTVQELNC
ncbi:IS66 family insertion sequence element accessory protein TnpB [Pseudomonas umsongensis]|uniref:IS66 family insertion sequence element accessory protein TnpB n=1 Tax=Pseudomonas umsongensis TaxID=198618 RepID=UPI0003A6C822|nr:hypothetical protein [Pseudomonas umsongensis]